MNTSVSALVVKDMNLIAGTNTGVFLSTNNGTSWTADTTGLTNPYILSFLVSGPYLFAGTLGGVFLSTNNGTIWTLDTVGLSSPFVNDLAVLGTNLFAGTSAYLINNSTWAGGGVYLSTNNGTSWTAVDSGLTNPNVYALAVLGEHLFAGTGSGVFLSTNNGNTWLNTGLPPYRITALAASETNLFAGTDSGVFRSTNSGASWITSDPGLTGLHIQALLDSGAYLFAGTMSGFFFSTNSGTSWTESDSGLTYPYITALAISDQNLYVGTSSNGVCRQPLSEITGISQRRDQPPTQFALQQNYPNPFNPTTVISYEVAVNSLVTLKVYDILGREVETLVNERQTAGTHSVLFDGSNLAGGVYFYRIQAENYVDTKKLVLLK